MAKPSRILDSHSESGRFENYNYEDISKKSNLFLIPRFPYLRYSSGAGGGTGAV